jgi:hypothetical protein
LTHQEVRAVAADLGLGAFADGLVEALIPVYRLEPTPDGAHRVGGTPDLVAGERWPRNERGVELTFIAQFDTSRIPPLPGAQPDAAQWLADPAFVRLFADLHDRPFDLNRVVALVADPGATRARAAEPDRPPSLEDTDEELILSAFAEQAVDTVPGWRLDEAHPVVAEAARIDHGNMAENVPLLDFVHVIHAGRLLDQGSHVLPQLLGPPDETQDDPRYDGASMTADPALNDIAAWTLLLELDDSYAEYGDGGGFYVVIPRADLAQGRYDRAVATSQSG